MTNQSNPLVIKLPVILKGPLIANEYYGERSGQMLFIVNGEEAVMLHEHFGWVCDCSDCGGPIRLTETSQKTLMELGVGAIHISSGSVQDYRREELFDTPSSTPKWFWDLEDSDWLKNLKKASGGE